MWGNPDMNLVCATVQFTLEDLQGLMGAIVALVDGLRGCEALPT